MRASFYQALAAVLHAASLSSEYPLTCGINNLLLLSSSSGHPATPSQHICGIFSPLCCCTTHTHTRSAECRLRPSCGSGTASATIRQAQVTQTWQLIRPYGNTLLSMPFSRSRRRSTAVTERLGRSLSRCIIVGLHMLSWPF